MNLEDLGLTCAPVQTLFALGTLLFTVLTVLAVVFWVLEAVAVYTVSAACDRENPWFAFVPVLRAFALGRLADLYRGKNNRRFTHFAKAMAFFSVATLVLSVAGFILAGVAGIRLIFEADAVRTAGEKVLPAEQMQAFLRALIPMILAAICAAVLFVIRQVCLWRVYRILNPERAVLFLFLGIIFPILPPIFLFVLRNHPPILSFAERTGAQTEFRFGS